MSCGHSPSAARKCAWFTATLTASTISAIGTADGNGPADERTRYPEDWLGLVYPDSKHAGERAAREAADRHGIELVIVNPGYVLGVPVNRSQPGETSTRTIGNYLRGRLPAVLDAPMNFVDVDDVAIGHLLAAERGTPGERYILGAENVTWPRLIEWYQELIETGAFAGSHHSNLSRLAATMRVASRVGLLVPVRVGQRVTGRRILAGG